MPKTKLTDADEPFTVHQDLLDIVFTFKTPSERESLVKGLRKTLILRKLKPDPNTKDTAVLTCKTLKKANKMLRLVLITMNTVKYLPLK